MSRSGGAAEDGHSLDAGSAVELVSAPAIGKLQRVMGLVTITRANVAVVRAAVGDLVYAGDVVETGRDGTVAIEFVDGTKFHLCTDARLVLDEFVWGAKKSSHSALLRLVRGVFGFIAGRMATNGHLIIDTPFARIRSTTPGLGIGSVALTAFTFGLLHDLKAQGADIAFIDYDLIDYKDLKHGMFEIITKGDHPQVIIVDDPQTSLILRLRGSGVSVQQVLNSPLEMRGLESDYHGALGTFNLGQQDAFIQHWQKADVTPQSTGTAGSSSLFYQPVFTTQTFNAPNTTAVNFNNIGGTSNNSNGNTNNGSPGGLQYSNPVYWTGASGGWNGGLEWSDQLPPASWQTFIINAGASSSLTVVTFDEDFSAASLGIGPTSVLDITGGSLTVPGTVDDYGLIKVNTTGVDPTLTFERSANVFLGGEIEALGNMSAVYFYGSVDNSGKIIADDTLDVPPYTNAANVVFEPGSKVTNEAGGQIIAANNGAVILETGNTITNHGTLGAVTGGTLTIDDPVDNSSGIIEVGGMVTIIGVTTAAGNFIYMPATFVGGGTVILNGITVTGGAVTDYSGNFDVTGSSELSNLVLTNDEGGTVDVTGTLILATGHTITNAGLFETTGGGTLDIQDSEINNSGKNLTSPPSLGIVRRRQSTFEVDASNVEADRRRHNDADQRQPSHRKRYQKRRQRHHRHAGELQQHDLWCRHDRLPWQSAS